MYISSRFLQPELHHCLPSHHGSARTSLAALIRELHATEHRVQDLKTVHEKELADLKTDHQRQNFELEAGHAQELADQEEEFETITEESEEELEELRDTVEIQEYEIYDLQASLRVATANVKRLEKELTAEQTKDRAEERERRRTRIQSLERSLAQEKAESTESADVKTQLVKVQKQWASMGELFSGPGQHMDVGASEGEDAEAMRRGGEDAEDVLTCDGFPITMTGRAERSVEF
jgi:galactokinase/mevalonate kinase-like predicted kinase